MAQCPRDQIEGFYTRGIVLQPKQLRASALARTCDHPDGPTEIAYGGARGGGKSHWALAQLTDDCLRFPGLTCLFLRKVGKSARESLEELRRKVLAFVPHEYIQTRGQILFPNGSRIILGHFQSEGDIDAYLGLEYDVIAIEEATTLTASKVKNITTVNRSSKGWRPRMYLTTNPGGIGHAWFKDRYIKPFKQGKETFSRFVPATIYDNGAVNTEYRQVLERLTGWQRKAWLEGDWDIAAGQFFTTWRESVHVVAHEDVPLTPGVTPALAAMDYGFTHFTVVHLGCLHDGNLFIADEHAERRWLPQRHAPALEAMLTRNNLRRDHLSPLVAGRDIWQAKGDSEGRTIADQYSALGWNFTAADDDRINGWGEILQRLGDVEAGIAPTLFISDRCQRLIECIPALEHNPHRPEDVLKVDTDDDGVGGDDPGDCARYLAMAAPSAGAWTNLSAALSARQADTATGWASSSTW
jgi:phage terminase large subunit